MFAFKTKFQIISAYFALQTIAFVTTQPLTTRTTNINIRNGNLTVSTPIQDYILKNQYRYNATLQSYRSQINEMLQSLENQLVGFTRLKIILLNTIEDAYKDLVPLQLVNLESKYCVQKYNSQLPYGPIVKIGIESCIAEARNQADNIVQPANVIYNILNGYYNRDLKKALSICAETNSDLSTNYTICVKKVIANANKLTTSNRRSFNSGITSAKCALDTEIDNVAYCTSSFYNEALQSVGAVIRLINECIEGFAGGASQNNTITVSCPFAIDLKLKDSDFQNSTITNPFKGLDKRQKCVEIRYL